MRKLLLLLLITFTAIQIQAQNPHLVGSVTWTTNGTTITASGTVAGLGNNDGLTISLAGDCSVNTTCINPGGHVPPGLTREGSFDDSEALTSDQNGHINFSISLNAVSLVDTKNCPNGKFTKQVTTDWTSATLTIPGVGTYSY